MGRVHPNTGTPIDILKQGWYRFIKSNKKGVMSMVSKRGIPIYGIVVYLFFFVLSTASTAADKVPKTACVKNNAGVVLKVGQDLAPDFSDPFPLGQSIKFMITGDFFYCVPVCLENTSVVQGMMEKKIIISNLVRPLR